jgi:hypothetical protein
MMADLEERHATLEQRMEDKESGVTQPAPDP